MSARHIPLQCDEGRVSPRMDAVAPDHVTPLGLCRHPNWQPSETALCDPVIDAPQICGFRLPSVAQGEQGRQDRLHQDTVVSAERCGGVCGEAGRSAKGSSDGDLEALSITGLNFSRTLSGHEEAAVMLKKLQGDQAMR